MAGSRAQRRQSFAGSAALAAFAVLSTAVADARGGWVLVRPPLDVPRLEALGRDPAALIGTSIERTSVYQGRLGSSPELHADVSGRSAVRRAA